MLETSENIILLLVIGCKCQDLANKNRCDTETQIGKPVFLSYVVVVVALLSLPFHFYFFIWCTNAHYSHAQNGEVYIQYHKLNSKIIKTNILNTVL